MKCFPFKALLDYCVKLTNNEHALLTVIPY